MYALASGTEFILPTNDERIEFEDSGVKEAAQGAGDSKTLMLIISAELAISSALGSIQRNETPEGETEIQGYLFIKSSSVESDPSAFVISAAALESLSAEEAAAAEEGLAKIAAMDDLINSGAESVSNPESALMVTNAIASILGSDDGNSTQSTVGIEVATKAIDATEVKRNFNNLNLQELF